MKKLKRISVHIDAQTSEKLARIILSTNFNISIVIAKAIDLYFTEKVKCQIGGWKELERAGFVGFARGEADLSENYKHYLGESLVKKV